MNNKKFKEIIDKTFDDATFYFMESQEYFISESYDIFGNVLDSHLMSVNEVKELNVQDGAQSETDATITKKTKVGSKSDSKGKLELSFIVMKTSSGQYEATGIAQWTTKSIIGGEFYPDAAGDDFLAITWGGKGELKCVGEDCHGVYN